MAVTGRSQRRFAELLKITRGKILLGVCSNRAQRLVWIRSGRMARVRKRATSVGAGGENRRSHDDKSLSVGGFE